MREFTKYEPHHPTLHICLLETQDHMSSMDNLLKSGPD